jgi:membrane protein DedA with SNARE-associated domain
MAHHLFELLRGYLAAYGYWTLAIVLLLENAGLPVPGETILLTASFLAYSEHRLTLPYIILVGVCAATLGDNIGFLIGHYGGRPLLARYRKALHISPRTISQGEHLFRRYGAVTVFFARFIAGLRVINGPLAGVLRMHWRKFILFNFLGAAAWVTTISCAAYFFGQKWRKLAGILSNFDIAVIVIVIVAIAVLGWRRRRKANSAQTPSVD